LAKDIDKDIGIFFTLLLYLETLKDLYQL